MPAHSAIHIIQDAERSGDGRDPENGQDGIRDGAKAPGKERRKNLRAGSRREHDQAGYRKAQEEFHLVMQKAPVIERPDQDEQGRRRHDSENRDEAIGHDCQ